MDQPLSKLFRELDPTVRKILTFDDSGNIVLYKHHESRWGFWVIDGEMPERLARTRHPSQLAADYAHGGLAEGME